MALVEPGPDLVVKLEIILKERLKVHQQYLDVQDYQKAEAMAREIMHIEHLLKSLKKLKT